MWVRSQWGVTSEYDVESIDANAFRFFAGMRVPCHLIVNRLGKFGKVGLSLQKELNYRCISFAFQVCSMSHTEAISC